MMRFRQAPFDFAALRELIERHVDRLSASVQGVFEQGWPDGDADVVESTALRAHVERFVNELEVVVARLRRRLRWAMEQIGRLNRERETRGTLAPDEEALFRRCDRFVKQIKATSRRRNQAEGYDDFNTFSVLAAEGFLPGYGLEVGAVVGWADIPFWQATATSFSLPRPPATALREYVPGNLIYANGHKFVARRFHREPGQESAEMPFYEVSVEHQGRQGNCGREFDVRRRDPDHGGVRHRPDPHVPYLRRGRSTFPARRCRVRARTGPAQWREGIPLGHRTRSPTSRRSNAFGQRGRIFGHRWWRLRVSGVHGVRPERFAAFLGTAA